MDKNDRLTRDYLIITRLPAFYDSAAFKAGMFMTFVGGANSLGTLGAQELIQSQARLQELYDTARNIKSMAWQALYQIDDVDGEVSADLIEVQGLSINLNVIENAMKSVWGHSVRKYFAD